MGVGRIKDAENRLVSATSPAVSYVYDGDGKRVIATAGGNRRVYVYDGQGNLAEEYDTQSPNVVGTLYLTSDSLGSTRLQTDGSGNVVNRRDYYPFGAEIPKDSTHGGRIAVDRYNFDSGVRQQFTAKERDAETGLDYFGARYFSGAQGRFTSPDWSASPQPIPYADLSDPQSLNLYAYVRNNPLRTADADGHDGALAIALESAALGPEVFVPVMGVYALYLNIVEGSVIDRAIDIINHPPLPQTGTPPTPAVAPSGIGAAMLTFAKSTARPGTLGKPDHQQTAAEEAERIGGEREVKIDTRGGKKGSRRADAAVVDALERIVGEIVQVFRPTPAGNIPKREREAAEDIEKATG